MDSILALTST